VIGSFETKGTLNLHDLLYIDSGHHFECWYSFFWVR